jgi:hypothetical protein
MRDLSTQSILIRTLVVIGVAGLFVLGAPSASLAAPEKKDCSGSDAFERLKCRHDALADQLEYTSDTVFADDTRLSKRTKPTRIKHIRNSRAKAQRAKVKNTKEKFRKLAKDEARGNKKAGHLVPLSSLDDLDGDDICDYEQGDANAKCAAVELSEFEELQECNPEKKNKGKGGSGQGKFDGLECDLLFDPDEASTVLEADDMEEAAEQMEETYSAVEDDFIEMNTHLETLNQNLPNGSSPVLAAANGCVLPDLTPGLAEAAAVLRGLTAAGWGAASIMDSATGQTVVVFGTGGNGRAAAIIVDSAALAVELAYITVDEILGAESSALQDATAQCILSVAGDIAALQALMIQQHGEIITNDDANTAMLRNQIEDVRAEVVQLLNTPQGRREEFPVK